jgi:hypothetical protein
MIMDLVLVVECNASGEPILVYILIDVSFYSPFCRGKTSKSLPMDVLFPAGYCSTCGHSNVIKVRFASLESFFANLFQSWSECLMTPGKELLQADVETVAW